MTVPLIKSITKNSNDFDEKYIKIKFNSGDGYLKIKQYNFLAWQ